MPPLIDTQLQAHGQKNDPSGTPVGPYAHGNGGLFNRTSIGDPLMSAITVPIGGILDVLPVYNASLMSDGEFGGEDVSFDFMLTGVTQGALDLFANQPTTECADGPVGGLMKLCKIANTFGRYKLGVREVSLVRSGRRAALTDPTAVQVLNNPLMQQVFGMASNTPSLQNAIGNEWAKRLFESAISFRRMFAPRIFSGSPSNNSGERKDIIGLDTFINENNKVDADTSAVCTAANSLIMPFAYDLVTGNGRDIVRYIEEAMEATLFKADRQGLNPIEGYIVMNAQLWNEVCNTWPVREFQFAMNQMQNFNSNNRLVLNGTEVYNARNQMRQSRMLPIKGRMWPVVVDDGITEQTPVTTGSLTSGFYASDVYFVPTTVMGGYPVTFLEFWDYDNAQSTVLANVAGQYTFTTDGGMFRWYINFRNGCLSATYEFQPRLRMRATQLAWRITNVKYQPLQHFTSFDPNSSYFVDGGNNSGDLSPQFYAAWSTSTPVRA